MVQEARGRLHCRLGLFGRNRLGDILRDLALQCENVSELSIVCFGPVWDSGGGVDKLHIDAHPITDLRNTAQQKLPGVRSLSDACGLDVLSRQSSDNLASDAIGKISVGFLLAQILEGQYGDRLIRQRAGVATAEPEDNTCARLSRNPFTRMAALMIIAPMMVDRFIKPNETQDQPPLATASFAFTSSIIIYPSALPQSDQLGSIA